MVLVQLFNIPLNAEKVLVLKIHRIQLRPFLLDIVLQRNLLT
jgi:hypothetical protein